MRGAAGLVAEGNGDRGSSCCDGEPAEGDGSSGCLLISPSWCGDERLPLREEGVVLRGVEVPPSTGDVDPRIISLLGERW